MTSAPELTSDAALIDATLAALRDKHRRAPADLLAILTALLVLTAGLMLVIGIAVGEGVAGDVVSRVEPPSGRQPGRRPSRHHAATRGRSPA